MVSLGDAFLIATPPNGKHLYIAIAPIALEAFLFVNTTSRTSHSEAACLLQPGSDVPDFICRESAIAYQYAREITAPDLAQLISQGVAAPSGRCSGGVVRQIQWGGLASKRLKNKYKDILKAYLGV